jgi:hypothetical protein
MSGFFSEGAEEGFSIFPESFFKKEDTRERPTLRPLLL